MRADLHGWKGFKKKKGRTEVPVDPTDQVMLRLKLLDAFIDISRFLLAFRMIRTEDKNNINDITKQAHQRSKEIVEILFENLVNKFIQ